jgi:hypothetical protein
MRRRNWNIYRLKEPPEKNQHFFYPFTLRYFDLSRRVEILGLRLLTAPAGDPLKNRSRLLDALLTQPARIHYLLVFLLQEVIYQLVH